MSFKKFPSIEQLHTITREALRFGKVGDIHYKSKIKLHGTNACVRINPDGSVECQKRTGTITPENDNYGFAKFVQENKEWFKTVFGVLKKGTIYIHGEWAGQDIQKTDAVSTLPKKFYVFMIETPDGVVFDVEEPFLTSHEDVIWIPCYKEHVLNFFDKDKMDAFVTDIEKDIESIGVEDPFIKSKFDVSGPGEGLVFYPCEPFDPTLMFKLKTEAHLENKRVDKKVITYSPEQVNEINTFAEKYCSEQRFQHALNELGLTEETCSVKDTGRFIGWVCKDVNKECVAELEASSLEWKDVAVVVTNKAKQWFFKKVK